ncbi:glycosyltransferase family 2 protein [Pleomorphovibrio marinus]|uniref:glycosyltransferase family 2 protein n=1 Tax=Pleomorphovibrio marinus TaxID=2164132 RepID=UPI001E2A67BF|nr:glycosyltransferase family 2 protein [Pleomorphovibrio marinus]
MMRMIGGYPPLVNMEALVITPVKDAIPAAIRAAHAVISSEVPIAYRIFNDNSTEEGTKELIKLAEEINVALTHLKDLTDTPSPNYKTVLQVAQKEALEKEVPLIIVESDVTVQKDTFNRLLGFAKDHPELGLVGAITVDENGEVNFPYLKFKGVRKEELETDRSLSFCCTLLSLKFLRAYDFQELDRSKHWYDTHISRTSLRFGFKNFVLPPVQVRHEPHGSRPWKKLKYQNPLQYYWRKFLKGLDKI